MNNRKTILITGGTGMIGTALVRHATSQGHRVIILTQQKNKKSDNPLVSYASWQVKEGKIEEEALMKADVIFHLAGAGVADKRWTKKYKEEICSSRVNAGKLLAEKLRTLPHHINTFISSSAIGWYGPDQKNGNPFRETDIYYNDFLGTTCQQWEESILPIGQSSTRLCIVRTGIVLSTKGGALKEFMNPIRMGIVPILGNGHQIMSWIHIDDLCRLFLFLMDKPDAKGIFNGVASEPVTNSKMMRTLAEVMHPPVRIPFIVPGIVLKLMLGESSIEVLKSTTVSNQKIVSAGFDFLYPKLKPALLQLLKK